MPVMDFLRPEDKPALQALYVSSVMFFPSIAEDERRENWLLKNFLAFAGNTWMAKNKDTSGKGEELKLSRDVGSLLGEIIYEHGGWNRFRHALIGQGKLERPGADAKHSVGAGIAAGILLQRLLGRKKTVGVGRAAEEVEPLLIDIKRTLPIKTNFPTSAKWVRQSVWPRFRPAAHLWGAYLGPSLDERASKSWLMDRKSLQHLPLHLYPGGGIAGFLALAEHFRKEAESLMPPTGARKPYLQPGVGWSVPSGYPLPALDQVVIHTL